jgi:hypothetical protein
MVMTNTAIRWLMLAAVLVGASVAHACSIPVFRYALERWPADGYTVLVYHKGPLAPADQRLADELASFARTQPVNAQVLRVDLAGEPTRGQRDIWEAQHGATLPWIVVRAPRDQEPADRAWAGPLTARDVKRLYTSPARKEIVKRLTAGDSVVWAFVPGGERKPDADALALLNTAVADLAKTLTLPDPTDLSAGGVAPPAPVPPLKLAFSTLTVPPGQDEDIFLGILRHSDPDSAKLTGPTVYPVFGQGRSLAVLGGKGLNKETYQAAAEYLIGACSCQVKEQNPGHDLLVTADWDALIVHGVVKDPDLPLLPTDDAGKLVIPARPLAIATDSRPRKPLPAVSAKPTTPAPAQPPAPEGESMGVSRIPPVQVVPLPQKPRPVPNHLPRNLAIALAAGLGLSGLVAAAMMRRPAG